MRVFCLLTLFAFYGALFAQVGPGPYELCENQAAGERVVTFTTDAFQIQWQTPDPSHVIYFSATEDGDWLLQLEVGQVMILEGVAYEFAHARNVILVRIDEAGTVEVHGSTQP